MEQYSMAEEVGFPIPKYGDGKTEESGPERPPMRAEDPSHGVVMRDPLDVASYLSDMVAQLEAMAIAAHLDRVAYFLRVANTEIDTSVRINAIAESERAVVESYANLKFVADDMPEANEMAVAEAERKTISARTKAALQAAKGREVKVGGDRGNLRVVSAKGRLAAALEARRKAARQRAEDLKPIISELRAHGITSLNGMAASLNARGVPAARGGKWTAIQVQRLGL
jgi:hypothetical protein